MAEKSGATVKLRKLDDWEKDRILEALIYLFWFLFMIVATIVVATVGVNLIVGRPMFS
jgi:hypothetical protein